MASSWKECTILIFVISWQITKLASSCPEICGCDNVLLPCSNCSYNITLKNNENIDQMLMSCNRDAETQNQMSKLLNKTYLEVTVDFENDCNCSEFILNLPLLETYSISLRNNSIIKFQIMLKHKTLRDLDLSLNKIALITRGAFNKYSNLRKLILTDNCISNILKDSFIGLTKLEYLDLSYNNLTTLTNVFTPLKNLQHLNLSRNNLEFIHENYFNNWLLQHLDVSHNNLKKLAPGALQLLPNLARLLLTDNPHLGITQVDTQLLVGTGRRLQQIDASRIGLYQVPEAFTHSVRFLSLIGNKITAIRCGDLDSYPLLQSLDFAENQIESVEDDSLGRLEMLLFLNINKNVLTAVPKSLPDELKYLSLSNNSIKNISIPDFKNMPNLRMLLLQYNQIQFIQDHVFDDLLSLEMLDLSYNPIQMLSPSTFDGPLSLRDLRLCYLNVSVPQEVGSFPMSSPESVQMLHLQSSPGLARQLLADSAALAAFSHLQYLDLRMNNLTDVRNDLLFYLVQLKTLRLHGNNINCSNELWLTDWMNWNKSLSDGETCYFSTSEHKADITKYNCTFQETFTINESLPPVSLYSTEMINKLLRYYGYLNNKTDRMISKHDVYINENKGNTTTEYLKNNKSLSTNNYVKDDVIIDDKLNDARKVNQTLFNDNFNGSSITKNSQLVKILDGNKYQNDQLKIDRRFLDIDVAVSTPSRTSKSVDYSDTTDVRRKSFSGKRLNTPILSKIPPAPYIFTTTKLNTQITLNEAYTANPNDKLEYSPYHARGSNYAQYIGTAAVTGLIVMSLILWLSFRLRFRRRRSLPVDTDNQIEVSNISGGVLW
ncbi:PREDICTED: toll-like receptor 3 [Papilio polytes]|uniref:toll-like receptor 3 n=1 Tax=Papilio polytes TaxID=76194 RepID=UPI000676A7FF|nr:PREDICTED: toll-like receptor 3 [Papilio polytes]XP_013138798.1 PREDICTED: toll-like receptor 3 [Papilio polytes]